MQQILNVVRGIDSWQVLKSLGVYRHGNTWYFDSYPNPVKITADDLIAGFSKHLKNKSRLREWASFMLADSSFISFELLEGDPHEDDLLNALWQAAFGEEVAFPPNLRLCLTKEQHKKPRPQ